MGFTPAKCPSCGGELQVPTDRESVKCMYCGGIIVVADVVRQQGVSKQSLFELANVAASACNHAEAEHFFTRVLELDPRNPEAWMGKGVAAGWQSTVEKARLDEMAASLAKAVECSAEEYRQELSERASAALVLTAQGYFDLCRQHAVKYIAQGDTWALYLQRCANIIEVLKRASALAPEHREPLECIVRVCVDNIRGIFYVDPVGKGGKREHKVTRIWPQYAASLQQTMDEAAQKIQVFDPTYRAPLSNEKSGCAVGLVICVMSPVVMRLLWP